MIEWAGAEGLRAVEGQVLRENTTMLAMCRRLGFSIREDAGRPGHPDRRPARRGRRGCDPCDLIARVRPMNRSLPLATSPRELVNCSDWRRGFASPLLRGEGRRRRQARAAGEGEGAVTNESLRRRRAPLPETPPHPRFACFDLKIETLSPRAGRGGPPLSPERFTSFEEPWTGRSRASRRGLRETPRLATTAVAGKCFRAS